mgnify:CR=1 FL=1
MWEDVLRAVALMLVFEGMMPFLIPYGGRQASAQAGRMRDTALATIAFVSLLIGLLVFLLHHDSH